MSFQEYMYNLKFNSIDTLPWIKDDDSPMELPVGIVLRNKNNKKVELIGTDIAGIRSTGCSCCSLSWRIYINDFDGWAWLIPPESI